MNCPRCKCSTTAVIESRQLRDGYRRRRLECRGCGHRWTQHFDANGMECASPGKPTPTWLIASRPRKLDEASVVRILEDDGPDGQIAAELGVTRQMVWGIRTGRYWPTFRPELPRREAKAATRSCETCDHWTGVDCGFGFPDPIEEGLEVAADCSMYFRK